MSVEGNQVEQDLEVSLREVTSATVKAVVKLNVSKEQEKLVASNAESIAEAYFADDAWFRAIYAGDMPVGFVMLSEVPEKAEYFVWRFMIDAKYQARGYGRRAMELVIEHVKTRPNASELYLTHMKDQGNAGGFYQKLGFEYTGDLHNDELVMKLNL